MAGAVVWSARDQQYRRKWGLAPIGFPPRRAMQSIKVCDTGPIPDLLPPYESIARK